MIEKIVFVKSAYKLSENIVNIDHKQQLVKRTVQVLK